MSLWMSLMIMIVSHHLFTLFKICRHIFTIHGHQGPQIVNICLQYVNVVISPRWYGLGYVRQA